MLREWVLPIFDHLHKHLLLCPVKPIWSLHAGKRLWDRATVSASHKSWENPQLEKNKEITTLDKSERHLL